MKLPFENGIIHYKTEGTGPALVFLHGFMETSRIWRAYLPALTLKFKVIRINLPGHGKSSVFNEIHSMEFMAGAVKAVLDQEKIKSSQIIGHSMGGYVAMAFADLFPERISAITLLSSTCFGDTDERKKERDKAIKAARESKERYVKATIPNLFFDKKSSDGLMNIGEMTELGMRQSLDGITAAIAGMRDRPDRQKVLTVMKIPVLLLGGKNDELVKPQLMEKMTRMTKKSKLVLLDNCGHNCFIEREKASLKAVMNFAEGNLP